MSSGAGGNLEMGKKLPEVVTLTSSDGENNNEVRNWCASATVSALA
jgi:hypothetical protein